MQSCSGHDYTDRRPIGSWISLVAVAVPAAAAATACFSRSLLPMNVPSPSPRKLLPILVCDATHYVLTHQPDEITTLNRIHLLYQRKFGSRTIGVSCLMAGGIKPVARCRRRMMIPSPRTTNLQKVTITVTVKGKQYCVMLSCDYGYHGIGILSLDCSPVPQASAPQRGHHAANQAYCMLP